MANSDEFNLQLSGELDQQQSKKNINDDIEILEKAIEHLKIQADIDPNSAKNIVKQLSDILNQKFIIDNIQIDSAKATKSTQQIGQKIGGTFKKSVQQSLNIDNIIDKQVDVLMSKYSIDGKKGSKAFDTIRQALVKYRQELADMKNLTVDQDDIFSIFDNPADINKVSSALANHIKFVDDTKGAYKELADYIKDVNSSGQKIHLPESIRQEYGDDFSSMRSQLGNAFTTGKGLDFESFITELNGELGNVIDMSHGAESAFEDLVQKVNSTKGGKFLSSDELLNQGFLDKNEIEKDIASAINIIDEEEKKLAQSSTTTSSTIIQNEKEKQKAYQQTANIQKQIAENESLIKSGANVTTFEHTNNAARDAAQHFQQLLEDENAVISVSEQFGESNVLTSFAVNVKRATGEVESLKYALNEVKDANGNGTGEFYFTNKSAEINNAGAVRQIRAIENAYASFTQKIEQFKASNSGKLSGLTAPLSDFESKLSGLKQGLSTIDEVRNAFKILQSESSKIDAPLKGQLNTFDSYKNAIEHGKDTISGYRAELKGLSNAPKELNQELTKASKLLLQINNTESSEGTTANWSAQAKEFVDLLNTIGNKINVIKKEQSNAATTQIFDPEDLEKQGKVYIRKVNNTIEKTKAEIESKLRNDKKNSWTDIEITGIEKANGQIKSLTVQATNAAGAFKELRFEAQKIKADSKKGYQTGLVQTDNVKTLKGSMTQMRNSVQSYFDNLKTEWEKQGILVGEFKVKIDQLDSSLSNIGSKSGLKELTAQIETLKSEVSSLGQINDIKLSIDNGDYSKKFELLKRSYEKLGFTNDEIKKKISEVSTALDKLNQKNLDTLIQDETSFNNALKKSQNEVSILKTDLDNIYNPKKQFKLSNDIQNWLSKNTLATKSARSSLTDYFNELNNGRVSISRLEYIEKELRRIDTAQRGLGRLGKSVIDQFKEASSSFTQWFSITSGIMFMVSETKNAISELKNLDSILTEISKTSDLTAQELEKLGNTSFTSANKFGKNAADYLIGIQEMSQSGFYGDKGSAMAEQSLLAQAAGDMNSEVANNYILATNAAYKYNGEAEKLNAVLDGQNSITNRNSVALEDMATAMSKAGTVASSYRVSIEDLSAMIGTIESVTKTGGEEVGNAIKSILINLQNITSSKIVGTLNEANASMTEFVDGAEKLRDPISILRDLSATFNQLDENDPLRAEILTNIGGKYQAAKLAALLQNMELFDKMLIDYSEGSGSAMDEASKSANNWEGSLNKLKNTWVSIVNNVADSDAFITAIKGLNDLLNSINSVTSALGSLNTISLAGGAFLGLKNLG